jgi:hypothetical protein
MHRRKLHLLPVFAFLERPGADEDNLQTHSFGQGQDHRFIKKRVTASLGFRSVEGACRTIAGYEAMHAIRKGQVRWVAKGDAVSQRQFIHAIFGITA